MRSWSAGGRSAAVLIGLGLAVGSAGAVRFDPAAVVGDRSVLLKWAPDADDPVYTGNLDLFPLGDRVVAAGDVPFFGFTTEGPTIWFWDDAQDWFVHLALVNSVWTPIDTTGRLGEGLVPACFAVHPMGTMLLAGLTDGRVAAWQPGGGSDDPVLYAAHEGAVRSLAFQPLASPQAFPFYSTGDDLMWRGWFQPGLPEPGKQAMAPVEGVPFSLLAVTRSSQRLALADEGGRIYIYSVSAPDLPAATITAHAGSVVTALSFSEDGRRLASADATGRIRLWTVPNGVAIGGDEVEADTRLLLAFTNRESSYLAYVTGAGTYGVIDGVTGNEYRVRAQLGSAAIRWMALPPAGGSAYFADGEGRLSWWNLGLCAPSANRPTCFGGYRLWRGLYPQDAGAEQELVELRRFDFSDSTWGWTSADTLRWFFDPDSVIAAGGDSSRAVAGPHNGVPFYYSLQKFYWAFLDGGKFIDPRNTVHEGFYRAQGETEPTALIARPNAVETLPLLGEVYVVPNPYVEGDASSQFGPLGGPLVRFFELPAEATVRIYTSGGDHVRTLEHRQDAAQLAGGSLPWDLKNDYGRDVVSGLYIYAVETPSGETVRGFFTIVR